MMTKRRFVRSASRWHMIGIGVFGSLAIAGVCWAGDEGADVNGARIIRKEATVKAPLAEVWRRWTTSEGVTKLFPQKAKIELAIGGAYEWYFNMDAPEGRRGSEGCKVLAFVPMEMIAFSWNAPPSIPKLRESGAKSQVIVRFEPRDSDRVRVTLTQVITETGADWDAYYQYFDQAWPKVLEQMQKSFGAEAASGEAAGKVAPKSEEPSPQPSRVKGEAEKEKTAKREGERGNAGASRRKQWAYYVRPAREDFEKGATAEEMKIVSAHAAYIKRMTDDGTVRYAGRSVGDGVFPGGAKSGKFEIPSHGIVVFEADSESEAKAIMEGDPAVREGVFLATLKPFQLAFESKK